MRKRCNSGFRFRIPGSRAYNTLSATAAYVVFTIALTWPLVRGIARDVPGDLGDPLLVMWILSWGAEQLRAILGGDVHRVASFFDANIFHPMPLTLAYSEHLFAQALQILPVYLVTKNPILTYNLLFLSTFVLSGLGGFLLVRELTGSARGAFAAGLFFAFGLYRWSHISHLQVLSAQWMPFALYGFHRYVHTGRRRALAGAAAALTLQNLSCGYYLLYFAPIVALFVAWELAATGRWRNRRTWIDMAVAALAVAAATVPFLVPYMHVRDRLQVSRDLTEIVRYSADVYSYLTASPSNRVWRHTMNAYPKGEGELFPGAVPMLTAAIAIALWLWRAARVPAPASSRSRRWLVTVAAAIGLFYAGLAAVAIFVRRIDLDLMLFTVRATNVTRLLLASAIALLLLVWRMPSLRTRLAWAVRQPEAIFAAILLLAWWMSLGPAPRVLGRPLELWAPYRVLYEFVPGYDGVRVPARFGMIVVLALSVLAGFALARLDRLRYGAVIVGLACAAFLVETERVPLSINAVAPVRDFATPEARVYRPARAPAVYQAMQQTPADAVLLEMPFGQPDYDVRFVYYSTAHWRRLVNGYSGFFPPHYGRTAAVLSAGPRASDVADEALRVLGVTHVIVHEGAYTNDDGARFVEWLRSRGAIEVFRAGSDVLFALPR